MMSDTPRNDNESAVKHVVIVGAGFAGLYCAKALASVANVRVTLLEKNNYQQFQPLLYQVATASLAPSRAAFSLRSVLLKQANIDIHMTEIVSVDLARKTVGDRNGGTYTGDYLVLAAGSQANFFKVPGVEEFAFPLYSLRDAERLRSRLIQVFEAADEVIARDASVVLHLAVIGGGPTGVEMAGAVADICHRAPNKLYKNLRLQDVVITLINGKDEVLSGFTEKSKTYARRSLEKRGVKLLLNTQVKELTSGDILLEDGTRIPCSLAIWAGGLKAAPLSNATNLQLGQGDRIDVQPDLSLIDYPCVYALGDFANTGDGSGKLLPQMAAVAQQAGRHCARNIAAHTKGSPTSAFAYFDKGVLAMIGRNAAIAEIGPPRFTLTGFVAFIAWLGVHALLLTTLPAMMASCFEWAWNYFGGVNVEGILDSPSQRPIGTAAKENVPEFQRDTQVVDVSA
jgi:NADH dehydrogenase